MTEFDVDLVIFGGGIAGLWLAHELRARGFDILLLEAHALGAGQTIASQGMIHGGLKYRLDGMLPALAGQLADLPERWRRCISNKERPFLGQDCLMADHQHVFVPAGPFGSLKSAAATYLLSSAAEGLRAEDWPTFCQEGKFAGKILKIAEPVVDIPMVLRRLAEPIGDALIKVDWPAGVELQRKNGSEIEAIHLADPLAATVRARRYIFVAGAGNDDLLNAIGVQRPLSQRRPLHMVMAKGPLALVYGHVQGHGDRPRLSISSHASADSSMVWYLGGALAEAGAAMDRDAVIDLAERELSMIWPALSVEKLVWDTLRIERAEPIQDGGHRPDDPGVLHSGNVIVGWPVKLALAPNLAIRIAEEIDRTGVRPSGTLGRRETVWPRPNIARTPCEQAAWS